MKINLLYRHKNVLQGVGFEPTQSSSRLWELKSQALDHSANLAILFNMFKLVMFSISPWFKKEIVVKWIIQFHIDLMKVYLHRLFSWTLN